MYYIVLLFAIAAAVGFIVYSRLVTAYGPKATVSDTIAAKKQRRDGTQEKLQTVGERVADIFGIDTSNTRTVAVNLQRAGVSMPASAFFGLQAACLAAFAVVGLLVAVSLTGDLAMRILAGVLFAALGFALPRLWLSMRAKKRTEIIRATFSGALELLSIVVGAGRTIEQGFRDVAERSEGPLADEFATVDRDIRFNRFSTSEALLRMADRCQVQQVSMFAAAVAQASAKGTEIGGVLKQQAKSAREAYYMDVEEETNKIRTKMIFPTIGLMLPTIFIVSLGPMVVQLGDTFAQLAA